MPEFEVGPQQDGHHPLPAHPVGVRLGHTGPPRAPPQCALPRRERGHGNSAPAMALREPGGRRQSQGITVGRTSAWLCRASLAAGTPSRTTGSPGCVAALAHCIACCWERRLGAERFCHRPAPIGHRRPPECLSQGHLAESEKCQGPAAVWGAGRGGQPPKAWSRYRGTSSVSIAPWAGGQVSLRPPPAKPWPGRPRRSEAKPPRGQPLRAGAPCALIRMPVRRGDVFRVVWPWRVQMRIEGDIPPSSLWDRTGLGIFLHKQSGAL